MTTLLAFIGAIALLVVFHELGHYWVARRCGVRVLRFSIGFGKVIYSKRFANSDTEWVISAIPLGGYVKMLDEREDEVAPEDLQYAFNRQPVLQRMAIVIAGPLANFLLAIVLYWALFVHGMPGLKPMLGEPPPGSPAALAQMQAADPCGEYMIRPANETDHIVFLGASGAPVVTHGAGWLAYNGPAPSPLPADDSANPIGAALAVIAAAARLAAPDRDFPWPSKVSRIYFM